MSARRNEVQAASAAARAMRALHELPRRALVALVLAYRFALKPWLGNACRFEPTCSAYALEALRRHGAAAGAALSTARLLRCHPWCQGGHDPVPQTAPRLFTRLFAKTRP
jgi:putative membrane protein insertion efficiency factor